MRKFPHRPRLRHPLGILAISALLVLLLPQTARADATTTSTIAPGLAITGATISGKGPQAGQTMDATTATQFFAGWFAPTFVGAPQFADPAKGASTYQVTTTYTYYGADGTFLTNVAVSGDSMWISLPAQTIWPGFGVAPEQADHWFVAPDVSRNAFGAASASTSTTTPSSGSSSSSSIRLIAIIVIVVLVLAGLMVVMRRRGRTAPGSR